MPITEEHTIYSVRKFFGVEDVAYLYSNKTTYLDLERLVMIKVCTC